MAIRIDRVDAGSEAEALGLAGGDELLSVDGNELNDTLDYDFYTDSKSFHLKAKVADGIREWDVRREERGPFGCDFSTYLGDQKHSCSNHCMFCFIDQLPPGMRESLYFKDDDERLSFLFGNYITMTNMQDHEIDRIIKMHISPINISVHTTNPQLRVRMLANKRGGEVLKYLPRLVEGGIAVNCQLVLCRGINDGDELRRTLTDLLELTPMVQSVAAVPCGVTDYRAFAKEVLAHITDVSVSFEVFADDVETMEVEAREIATWAENVYVKIPCVTTKGESTAELVRKLSADGIKVNVTTIFTPAQVDEMVEAVDAETPSIISLFAGRIADTGVDPIPFMTESVKKATAKPNCEVLWASTRELINIYQAEACGCQIITVPNSILAKRKNIGRDPYEVSLDTVRGFAKDIASLGFHILP